MDVVLQVIKEKIFEEILIVDMNFHQCSINTHNYTAWYNIMKDPSDSDPSTIISMCLKECTKGKEITCMKVQDTLLDMT